MGRDQRDGRRGLERHPPFDAQDGVAHVHAAANAVPCRHLAESLDQGDRIQRRPSSRAGTPP